MAAVGLGRVMDLSCTLEDVSALSAAGRRPADQNCLSALACRWRKTILWRVSDGVKYVEHQRWRSSPLWGGHRLRDETISSDQLPGPPSLLPSESAMPTTLQSRHRDGR